MEKEKEVMEDRRRRPVMVVKVSQEHVCHLRTFFDVEQIIVMNCFEPLSGVKRIERNDQGFTFYFNSLDHASCLVEYIRDIVPSKIHCHQIPSECSYNFFVEIVPICCGDLIFLPPDVAASFGANIVICTRVAKKITTLLDPFTLTAFSLKADHYWNAPFTHSFNRTQLVKYFVLNIVLQEDGEEIAADSSTAAKKYRLADAVVARVENFGNNDTTFQIRTHLGHILKSGDYALGYDLSGGGANTNIINGGYLPAAILIAKTNCDDGSVVIPDKWQSDYQLFLEDLRQGPHLTFNAAAMYRNQPNHNKTNLISVKAAKEAQASARPSCPLETLPDYIVTSLNKS
ncbi:hypothetical protein MtrunA17_Chr5g0442421 [Medicago truncatula]|uniref:Nonsense-mediated mRNA decay protein n=1 Tax=Medicago truncatula TaxID=3880 RepID=G7KD16_MEDTR|nr:60S ribosomal export protein NMD3 [Medicago truncatula]AET00291.2 nonsense-mediated mRNA decay protein [Medicago truncatula]RHN57619.1 hypothetical protein MtrunA17_Chr5g0442421 [Medicago truncatula]